MASQARGIQSIEVGGRLIEALTEATRPMMLRDLASRAGLAPAQAHAYLVSYRKVELVEQDPATGMYRLGPFAMRLGMARLRGYEPLRRAGEAAQALSTRLGAMVVVAVWGTGGPTLVQVEEGVRPVNINSQQGTVYSVTGTSTGRVFAAFGGDDEAVRRRIEFEFGAAGTHPAGAAGTSRAAFDSATASIRKRGYATAASLVIPGVNAISAPVLGRSGRPLCVMTVIGNDKDLAVDPSGDPVRLLLETSRTLTAAVKASPDWAEDTAPPPAPKAASRRAAARSPRRRAIPA